MWHTLIVTLIVHLLPLIHAQLDCNILDPECRNRYRQNVQASRPSNRQSACNYQDIWLIPGKADSSCTRPNVNRILDIDPSSVVINPEVIKLPGCFTIEIRSLRILEDSKAIDNSFFAKVEYQWWNLKEFGDLKCQNASNNGCGGFGNNCYYCDMCDSLSELSSGRVVPDSSSRRQLVDQFRGINCPQRAGLYTFRKEFCFNDWSAFDADGDCKLDFFQTPGGARSGNNDYRSTFASLQQIGYGTVVAKFRLAHNATGAVRSKRINKEAQIEQTVLRELEDRRRTWDVNNGQFEKFRQWYVEYRKNLWHKDDYLPWLLYENEVSCLRVTFDVCERLPRRVSTGFGSTARYTCK